MKIVLASNNQGKLKEFNAMFNSLGITMISQAEFAVPEVAETGTTFIANAMIKAEHAAQYTDLPVLADDSGLSVDSLAGAPGVYSARYAGEQASDQDNVEKLLQAMQGQSNRQAHFHCALVLLNWPKHESPIIVEGQWQGEILNEASGTEGFGYDPVFYVKEKNCSSAQLSKQEKNQISHRAIAMQKLMQAIAEKV